ncbi:hypothetical protein DUI87_16979 [Hirundo rustica rustica]|uniref:Methylosome subunit pICln n=1 Tax=Hirundo rustica rustica TaxID=333673 RepID=A0A3M0K2M9_HIRRU|nr:hypothetical protein DUI87_16979 [Hirundo rustica rustica]
MVEQGGGGGAMSFLKRFPPPADGIRHQQPDTEALLAGRSLGTGTLYIAESRLSWLENSGVGFSLDYPTISLHAVSRDLSAFPRDHLYVMVNAKFEEETKEAPVTEGEEDDSDDDVEPIAEFRFVPGDKSVLEAMFSAMCECQALHPDPDDEDSDNDYEGDEYDVEARGCDTASGIEGTLIKFANDTKLRGVVDTLEGWDAIQRVLDKPEEWVHGNLRKFNKAKCKVLHLVWGHSQYQHRLGDEGIKSSPAKKDLRVLLDEKLDVTWQCALAAQNTSHVLGCTQSSVASRVREGNLPFSTLVRPHLECCIQLLGPQHSRIWTYWGGSRGGHEDSQESGAPLLWKQAERVGIVQLEEKALGTPY